MCTLRAEGGGVGQTRGEGHGVGVALKGGGTPAASGHAMRVCPSLRGARGTGRPLELGFCSYPALPLIVRGKDGPSSFPHPGQSGIPFTASKLTFNCTI